MECSINNIDNFYNWATDATNTANTTNAISKAGDGAIIAAAVAGGLKLVQTAPKPSGKIAGAALGIAIGAGGIVAKNVSSYLSSNPNLPKLNFMGDELARIFHLTGNHTIDLLTLIQFFQQCQIILLFIIFYYFLIININDSKLELWLTKYLPLSFNNKLIYYIIKYVNYFKKSSFILLIWFFILLIFATYLSYHYLNFFY